MGKKAVLKFLIYTFYAVSIILTLLLLILPAWDNQDPIKVGIFLTDNNGDLDFGYMNNEQAKQSSIYLITVYTVVYLCVICLLNIAVIGLTSLESSRIAKWLNVILCIAHATGLIFIFFVYGVRYIAQWRSPLRNYYLDIFGILVDFILILLLILFKKSKKIQEGDDDVPMDEIKVEGNESGGIMSKLSSKKSKKNKKNSNDPQLITEGTATPLYVNGSEYVEPQPTIVAKPTFDESKIVVSDNIVNNETYIDNTGNQFQYGSNEQLEVHTAPAPEVDVNAPPTSPFPNTVNPNVINNQNSPYANPVNTEVVSKPQKLGSQYTYAESNPYPVAANTILKIPEIPVIETTQK